MSVRFFVIMSPAPCLRDVWNHLYVDITDICRVLESVKANRRLPESRFSPMKLAPTTQNSVLDMMRAKKERG